MRSHQSELQRNPWKTLSSREVYESPWIRVFEKQVINPAGKKSIYGLVHFRNIAVGVVAIDSQDRILLVGQYRYPLNLYSWEIPEGGCPQGSTPLETARRELKEETGYQARRMSKLLEMHLSNSSTDERAVVFLASELKLGQAEPEETEVLQVRWVPFQRALKMVEGGQITDAISVAAILRVDRMRRVKARSSPAASKKKGAKASIKKTVKSRSHST